MIYKFASLHKYIHIKQAVSCKPQNENFKSIVSLFLFKKTKLQQMELTYGSS